MVVCEETINTGEGEKRFDFWNVQNCHFKHTSQILCTIHVLVYYTLPPSLYYIL